MTNDAKTQQDAEREDPSGAMDDDSQLMSRYQQLARESQSAPSIDGHSVVANFALGGTVPRGEAPRARFQSSDIFVRLENTIYGPITHDELAELLTSGELTGYESVSADLEHWTPLIYHPRMTLAGEIDPDQTHEMLHRRSSLPRASRAPDRVDLEAIAELDEADLPSAPLAQIFIRPVQVSRTHGLANKLPVHADLDAESLDQIIERTEISPAQRTSGQQALARFAAMATGEGADPHNAGQTSTEDGAVGILEKTVEGPLPSNGCPPNVPTNMSAENDPQDGTKAGAGTPAPVPTTDMSRGVASKSVDRDFFIATGHYEEAPDEAHALEEQTGPTDDEKSNKMLATWLVVLTILAVAGMLTMMMVTSGAEEAAIAAGSGEPSEGSAAAEGSGAPN